MVLNGRESRFIEVAQYDINPGVCISEGRREAKAVDQVRQRHPDATKIEALSSISP